MSVQVYAEMQKADSDRQTVSGNGTSPYLLARSTMLDEPVFDALCPILRGITHTLANLVMPAREYPKLIRHAVPESSPATPLIDNLEQTAERLGYVNETLVRLCHGNEGPWSRMDLAALTRQILVEFSTPDNNAVTVHATLEPVWVEGPPDALYYAVHNLCGNAFKAVEPVGELTVRTDRLTAGRDDAWWRLGVKPGAYARFSVRDTGPGVNPSCRATLFDPFVVMTPGDGLGLGLSMVYRTAVHLNGYMVYNPDCAPGAEFIMLIPDKTHEHGTS